MDCGKHNQISDPKKTVLKNIDDNNIINKTHENLIKLI